MSAVSVRLFGAFRKYIPSGEILVEAGDICSAAEFRQKIAARIRELSPDFADVNLVSESVLANDVEILEESTRVKAGDRLAFLPPVCGG
jgi:molybdopterin converting factor small subunit